MNSFSAGNAGKRIRETIINAHNAGLNCISPCARMADDNTLGGLIPYKNAPALWAYYLGVFSLIPFFGFPLGIAAFIFGIKGLKKAARHPEMQGKIHARVGIILGGLCTLLHVLGIFVLITECL